MNTSALSILTPADVDTLKSALRLAIRTEKQTLSHERSHLPPGAIQSIETRIRSMERLADGLRPGTPPELPECSHCEHRCANPEPPATGRAASACDDRR